MREKMRHQGVICRVAVAVSLLFLTMLLIGGTYAPHSYSEAIFKAQGGDCVRCQTPPGNCWPNCCTSYTQIYISNVRVTGLNSTWGSFANVSWSDTPSTASDLFYWWTVGSQTNHSVNPSSHSVSLNGLPPYSQLGFLINAYKTLFPSCYKSAVHSGDFTPYYPHTASLTVYVYNGTGGVTLNGKTWGNGATVSIYSPDTFPIVAAIRPGADAGFYYWYASIGDVGALHSSSTIMTLDGTQTSGELLLTTVSAANWGGFAESGLSLAAVSGMVSLPESVSYVPGNQTGGVYDGCIGSGIYLGAEQAGIWVGIGGANGSENLWQAGVAIGINSTGSPWISMFIEDYPYCPVYSDWGGVIENGTSGLGKTVLSSAWEPTLGDQLEIYISVGHVSPYGPVGNFTIHDLTRGSAYYWPALQPNEAYPLQYVPDETTAEWIDEVASAVPQMMNMSAISFTNMTVNQAYASTNYITLAGSFGAYVADVQSYYSGAWTTYLYTPTLWGGLSYGRPSFTISFGSVPGLYVP